MLADSRLKLRHLTLALAIAKHGSVIRAAESLHVTQPVLSRGLQELESILEVKLFDRNPRGMTPTVFGEAFLEHAHAIDLHLRDARQYLNELADASVGIVTVGIYLAGSNQLLPRAIASMKSTRPRVTVVVHEASPYRLRASLLAGEIDLIVGRLPSGEPPAGLRRLALHSEPIRLVVARGHPALMLPAPRLEDLLDYPWILPGAQTELRRELDALFRDIDADLPDNRIDCTSLLTVRALLMETQGVAALPSTIADADPDLEVLPIELRNITRHVGVTLRASRHLSPSAAALLEHLQAAAIDLRESASRSGSSAPDVDAAGYPLPG
jgi:DNA-binding transcriptional LysR family regulator